MSSTYNSLFFGKVCFHPENTGSTNAYASELIKKQSIPEGTVIFTYSQTEGRGQYGSGWYTGKGKNLAWSVILHPTFLPVEKQFYLSMALANGVREAMAELLPKPVFIKWPNDIMVQEGKLAGILIENSITGSKLNTTIAGVGLNVNEDHFPPDLPAPVSMAEVAGTLFDLDEMVEALNWYVERNYLLLRKDVSQVRGKYLEHLYKINQTHTFKAGEEVFEAKVLGVTLAGKLVLQLQSGNQKEFAVKEVEWV